MYEFREYITGKIQVVQQIQGDKQLLENAKDHGGNLDDFIFSCLEQVHRQEYLAKHETSLLEQE